MSSDFGTEITVSETENLYYNNMNTGELLYEFINLQQDEPKKY